MDRGQWSSSLLSELKDPELEAIPVGTARMGSIKSRTSRTSYDTPVHLGPCSTPSEERSRVTRFPQLDAPLVDGGLRTHLQVPTNGSMACLKIPRHSMGLPSFRRPRKTSVTNHPWPLLGVGRPNGVSGTMRRLEMKGPGFEPFLETISERKALKSSDGRGQD